MKRFKINWALWPFFILLMVFPVRAEEAVTPEEEVVVTATRTSQTQLESPGMTEVITRDEIGDSGAQILSEVLMDAGLTVSNYGGDSGTANIQIDGCDPEQTMVMINGVPANTSTTGTVDISCFPVSLIKKIEVVHGPLSALYGANALGGVVNILTDLTGTPETSAVLSSGSFDSSNLDLIVQAEKWGFALGGGSTDGHRENSANDMRYLFGQYDFILEETKSLILYLQLMDREGGSPGIIHNPTPNDLLKRSDYSFSLIGRDQLLNGTWEYKFFGQYLNYEYLEPVSISRHRNTDLGLDVAGLYSLDSHELLTGFILETEDFESTDSNNHTRDSGGFFFQDTWAPVERWRVVSGIRWDKSSDFTSPVSPRVNLVYLPSESLSFKIGYGKAFRAPTINDLYWDQPSYGMYGNPDLKPEKADRYDLVGEWRKGSQTLVANLFHADVKDEIDWVAVDPSAPYSDWTVKNVDRVKIDGLILHWEKNWAKRFSVKVGYNYLDKMGWNETAKSYSDTLNFFGKNRFFLDLGFTISKLKLNLNWQQITDRQQETVLMSDYGLLNINATYNGLFNLAVRNVTDEAYQIQDGYPMPGREYLVSIKCYL